MTVINVPEGGIFGAGFYWLGFSADGSVYSVYTGMLGDYFGPLAFRVLPDGRKEWITFPQQWRQHVGCNITIDASGAYVLQQTADEKGFLVQPLPGFLPRLGSGNGENLPPVILPDTGSPEFIDYVARDLAKKNRKFTESEITEIWNKLVEFSQAIEVLNSGRNNTNPNTIDVLWNDNRAKDWVYHLLVSVFPQTIRGIVGTPDTEDLEEAITKRVTVKVTEQVLSAVRIKLADEISSSVTDKVLREIARLLTKDN